MKKTFANGVILLSMLINTNLAIGAEEPPVFDPGLPPPTLPAGYYQSAQKLVEQINIAPTDEQDLEQFYLKLINNSNNYYNAVSKANGKAPDMRIIIHGDGINMLLAAQDGSAPKLAEKLDALLAKDGVHLLVCYNTLVAKKITINQLYHVTKDNIVLAGVAEIARLQGLGFAYLKL